MSGDFMQKQQRKMKITTLFLISDWHQHSWMYGWLDTDGCGSVPIVLLSAV